MNVGSIVISDELSPQEISNIEQLSNKKAQTLHREALTEQATDRLHLHEGVEHFLVMSQEEIVGYAQGVPTNKSYDVEFLGDEFEGNLIGAIRLQTAGLSVPVALWIHGITSESTQPFSGTLERTILRLSRPLDIATTSDKGGDFTIRSFDRSSDVSNWLNLNKKTFASHPEQGGLTLEEATHRFNKDWFNAAGFFLAEIKGSMIGFCWTKIHQDPWGSAGEIYVIGVDPSATGKGIAKKLLNHSFDWLVGQGLSSVFLYCESDNVAALALYRSMGFVEEWQDQRWVLERS